MAGRALTALLVLAAAGGAGLVAYTVSTGDPEDDPPPVTERAPAPPIITDTDRDLPDLIAERLVAELSARSQVSVSPEEGRCLAEATLEVVGVDGLLEIGTGAGRPLAATEESALLRAVVRCLDADRATALLQIPAPSDGAVPLPGEEDGTG
jgi:hypothetical protein